MENDIRYTPLIITNTNYHRLAGMKNKKKKKTSQRVKRNRQIFPVSKAPCI